MKRLEKFFRKYEIIAGTYSISNSEGLNGYDGHGDLDEMELTISSEKIEFTHLDWVDSEKVGVKKTPNGFLIYSGTFATNEYADVPDEFIYYSINKDGVVEMDGDYFGPHPETAHPAKFEDVQRILEDLEKQIKRLAKNS